MLRKLSEIRGFSIAALDDEIGSVDDFYFEDDSWSIRYVVVDTGPWILGRQVLISPAAIQSLIWDDQILAVNLTKDQVKNSPGIGVDEPVSRQHEIELHNYYGWPGYWTTPGVPTAVTGIHTAPIPPATAIPRERLAEGHQAVKENGDPHLRSMSEVLNYNIQATDDDIGHVEDFFADADDWRIRYMLVDTRNWLPGRKVLVGTDWIESINWMNSDVHLTVTRGQVEKSPEYDPKAPLTRDYETNLYRHYQIPGYWT